MHLFEEYAKVPIENIVLDLGNVIFRWDPLRVVNHMFSDVDTEDLTHKLFKSSHWLSYNKGLLSENELISLYHKMHHIKIEQLKRLMSLIKASLIPIEGSFDLLKKLSHSQYPLYALTDNTKEIMIYLKSQYDIWHYFQHIVVSAHVGYLKPSREIYHYLLSQNHLKPENTLFIDDHLPNIKGAKTVGIRTIHFQNTHQCIDEMKHFNINL